MYAEKETDELLFQKTSKGDLELLANDFSMYVMASFLLLLVVDVVLMACLVCMVTHAGRWTWKCRPSSAGATPSRASWPTSPSPSSTSRPSRDEWGK